MCFVPGQRRNNHSSQGITALLNFLIKKAFKINAKLLAHSYLTVKAKNPDTEEKNLYALLLQKRHGYQQAASHSRVFTYKNLRFDVSKFESVKHLIAAVIIAEQRDLNLSLERQLALDTILDTVIDEQLAAAGIDLMT